MPSDRATTNKEREHAAFSRNGQGFRSRLRVLRRPMKVYLVAAPSYERKAAHAVLVAQQGQLAFVPQITRGCLEILPQTSHARVSTFFGG